MPIEFASSPRSTLGIEWELTLVDRHTRELVSHAPQILMELEKRWPSDSFPHFSNELLQNTIELVSAPHTRVSAALQELRGMVAAVSNLAEQHHARVIGSGTHPFSRWDTQNITDSPRYKNFIEHTSWWGRNMLIWGVHTHLGVDRKDRVVPLMHALLAYLPHMQALASSSPFWGGESTGYASNRTLMFQQLPTAGLPWDVNGWDDIERILEDLVTADVITEPTQARWDVRPAPRWGTIELRACDGASTLWEIGALAAFSQCLIEKFQRQLDGGEAIPRLPPWYVRENKWRAARYGLEADIIVDADGTQVPVREHLRHVIDDLAPVAESLGCTAELTDVSTILQHGNSSARQLSHFASNGTLTAVVDALADELQASLD